MVQPRTVGALNRRQSPCQALPSRFGRTSEPRPSPWHLRTPKVFPQYLRTAVHESPQWSNHSCNSVGRSVVGAHGIVSLCCRAYLRVSPLGAAEPPCRRCRAEPSRAERATERLAGVLGGGGLRDREAKEQLGGHEGTCARMHLVRNLSEATSRSPLALLVYSSS